jgi:hypothetical protein
MTQGCNCQWTPGAAVTTMAEGIGLDARFGIAGRRLAQAIGAIPLVAMALARH